MEITSVSPTPRLSAIEFFDNAYSRYSRYWVRGTYYSLDPDRYPQPWSDLLRVLAGRPAGRALDLGAGEGADAIRLALMGYEVDAVEGSAVGAEKIERFARQAGARVNVQHADVRTFQLNKTYDVIICNGLLHYVEDMEIVIRRMQKSTVPGGYNLVFMFSDDTPVPDCHRVVPVFCDREDGVLISCYQEWRRQAFFERSKQDRSHRDFPPHVHSLIKLLATRPLALAQTA